MCGLAAAANTKKTSSFLFDALKRLEYRGYDSYGFITTLGKLLKKKSEGRYVGRVNKNLPKGGTYGLAHVRWASSSEVCKANTHPIYGGHSYDSVAVVHNGNIENYAELKHYLTALDSKYMFYSDTDTEVLAHWLDYWARELCSKNADLLDLENWTSLFEKFHGRMAFAAMLKQVPGFILLGSFGLPLVVSDCFKFAASDAATLSGYASEYFALDYELCFIGIRTILHGRPSFSSVPKVVEPDSTFCKMLQEIHEQPNLVKANFEFPAELINSRNIHLFGCGSSYNAALLGQLYLENPETTVQVSYSSHLASREIAATTLVGLSQSGETADTIAVVEKFLSRKNFTQIYSLLNNTTTSLARLTKAVDIKAGPELSVAATKSFTQQVLALRQWATLRLDKHNWEDEVEELSNKIRVNLNNKRIAEVAERVACYNHILYLGRGMNYPIALEGALKMKEVSYIHAEGMHAAEMKHGPIALIDEKTLSIFLMGPDGSDYTKIRQNMLEIKARGGIVLVVGRREPDADLQIRVEFSDNLWLNPLLINVSLQLLAYYVGVKKGVCVDRPRSLAKCVSVE